MDANTLKSILEVEAEGETAILDSFRKASETASDEACDAVVKAYRLLSAHAETLPEGTLDNIAKSLDGTAAGAIETLSEIEKGKLKWIAQQLGMTEEALKAAMDGAKKPDEDEDKPKAKKSLLNEDGTVNEEIAKSYPEDVREEMVSLAKAKAEQDAKIANLEKERAAEKDAATLRQYVEKAAAYTNLGAVPETFAPVLKAIDERLEKGEAETLTALLSNLAKLVEKSEVLKEIGASTVADEDESPMAQLKKAAAEIRKAEPSLTAEQAFTRACQVHKDLTAAHYSR